MLVSAVFTVTIYQNSQFLLLPYVRTECKCRYGMSVLLPIRIFFYKILLVVLLFFTNFPAGSHLLVPLLGSRCCLGKESTDFVSIIFENLQKQTFCKCCLIMFVTKGLFYNNNRKSLNFTASSLLKFVQILVSI